MLLIVMLFSDETYQIMHQLFEMTGKPFSQYVCV